MESATIATFVNYFNIVLITGVSLFAVLGAVVVFRRKALPGPPVYASDGKTAKRQKKAPQASSAGGNALLSAFCVAALAALALEATAFNFQSYLKLFAGPELNIVGASPDDPNVILTSAGTPADMISEEDETAKTQSAGVGFKKLDMNVTSVFVNVGFGDAETVDMIISWTDEMSNANSLKKKLIKRMPQDNYTALQPCGKVSELKVMFTGGARESKSIEIRDVALNKRIPFYFSGLRAAAWSLVVFAAICLFRKEQRAKAAFYLFEYKFNPADLKQNLIYALLVIILIMFSWVCVYSSYTEKYMENPVHKQYNKFLVDALSEGRTWLNYGDAAKLLKAERPYDNNYRIANGYKFNDAVMWEWAWYKGKFYCYFGVVPAAILYLPYKTVTGEYLSMRAGIIAFSSLIIILMALLWRFCVKKYMPNSPFAFYILSFLTLFFASGIFSQLRFTRLYCVVQLGGVMFALAGIYLLLKSTDNEKVNRLKLFFACLCLALVVGCRPNMIFVSILVPFVLWKYRSWKLLPFVVIPYVIVAIPLCVYNYVRFESIFEFGAKYNLTGLTTTSPVLNPIGTVIKTILSVAAYLFFPYKYSLYFPFVENLPAPGNSGVILGIVNNIGTGGGIANFPIVLCLPYIFKNIAPKDTRALFLTFAVIGAIIITFSSFILGFSGRYLFDFAFFLILPSLFCAYYWWGGGLCINTHSGGIRFACRKHNYRYVLLRVRNGF